MKFSDIELPSNRKFGFFFTCIISAIGIFFFYKSNIFFSYTAFLFATLFLLTTLLKPDLLLTLNKIWMRFGFVLGIIINPIVLGSIFFLLFTPISLVTRLFRRDELRLKLVNRPSQWKKFTIKSKEINEFKKQF